MSINFSGIVGGLIGAFLSFFLLAAILRSGKKQALTDNDGWTHLSNTPGIIIIGLLCIPFGVLFLLMTLAIFIVPEHEKSWLLFLLGAPLTAFMGFGIYATFFVTAKFNDVGVRYKRLSKWHFIQWQQLYEVVDHSMWGTYIKSDIGRLWVWKYRQGFSELLVKLCENNIKGARELAEYDFEEVLSIIEELMIKRVWEYREEKLYPALFGNKSEGIFVLTLDMFRTRFKCDEVDPRWLTYGVHVYEPTANRKSWVYVTSGMSNPTDGEYGKYSGVGYEFVIETPKRADWAIDRLAVMLALNLLIASGFYGDKPLLDFGDRVPLEETIDGSEDCEIRHFLLNEPKHFTCSHELESGEFEFIHLLGTTDQENKWASKHGSDDLLQKLTDRGLANVTDPKRTSIM